MKDISMPKVDPWTGEVFIPKRSNQKFATIENKIKYNNSKAKIERKATAKLDKPLLNNKRILDKLMIDKDEQIFSQDFLLGAGFNYAVTNRVQGYEGINYYCVYEYILVNNKELKHTKIIKDARY